jgi:RND family efflux transporter MFP subunit
MIRPRTCLLMIAMIALAAAGCGRDEHAHPPTPVRVQAVGPYRADAGARYSAGVEPVLRADLSFRVPGYVSELHLVPERGGSRPIQEGDLVAKGTLLARLRQTDYDQKVQQARSALAEAEAMAKQARLAYERADALFKQNSLSGPDYEAAQASQDAVAAKVKGARSMVRDAELALADTGLHAPMDGVVLKRSVDVGTLVGPGSPGFVIADTSSVKVTFGAPDWMVTRLKVGSAQPVTTEAYPGREFMGTLTHVSRVADVRNHLFDVEITIPNRSQELKVGMVSALQLSGAPREAADPPVVTISAIVRSKEDPSGYAVFVVEDKGGHSVARLRTVTLGTAYGNEIAVTSGLRAGEKVIVQGATLVSDQDPVNVIS